jgi:hypothetical protein
VLQSSSAAVAAATSEAAGGCRCRICRRYFGREFGISPPEPSMTAMSKAACTRTDPANATSRRLPVPRSRECINHRWSSGGWSIVSVDLGGLCGTATVRQPLSLTSAFSVEPGAVNFGNGNTGPDRSGIATTAVAGGSSRLPGSILGPRSFRRLGPLRERDFACRYAIPIANSSSMPVGRCLRSGLLGLGLESPVRSPSDTVLHYIVIFVTSFSILQPCIRSYSRFHAL